MQALISYEEAAKLRNTAEFKQKIASLKKQIQRGKAGGSQKAAADKENHTKPASSFAFANGRSNTDSTASDKSNNKIQNAPTVGEIKDDADYAEAKKSMV